MKANGQTAWVDNDGKICSITDRHPGTQQIMRWLVPDKNLPIRLYAVSLRNYEHAVLMLAHCPDGPELTAGLRKLLEAKDCFVRASMEAKPL